MKKLSNRPNSQELIEYFEIKPFELPELIRKGLPAYSGTLGKPVRNLDALPKTHYTADQKKLIELAHRVMRFSKAPPPIEPVGTNQATNRNFKEEQRGHERVLAHIEKMETEIQELKDRGVKYPPPYQYPSDHREYKWLSFAKPVDKKDAAGWLNLFMGLWFKREDVLNFTETNHNKSSGPFPCRPGTQWQEVSITLVDFETVRVAMPGCKARFTYHELKMANKKTKKPILIWYLMAALTQYSGRIDKHTPIDVELKDRLTSLTKRLNSHMQDLFGIKDSIYKDYYNKHKEYAAKIEFNDETIPTPEKKLLTPPLCENCDKRDSCTEPCDDVERYVNEGRVNQGHETETNIFDEEVADTIRKGNISKSQLYQD